MNPWEIIWQGLIILCLPTALQNFSPLSVDDFIKISIISYTKEALEKVHKDIEAFALSEGLSAHANSIAVRFDENYSN